MHWGVSEQSSLCAVQRPLTHVPPPGQSMFALHEICVGASALPDPSEAEGASGCATSDKLVVSSGGAASSSAASEPTTCGPVPESIQRIPESGDPVGIPESDD